MNTAVDAGRSYGAGGAAPRGAASTADLARTALQQAGRLARAESRAGLAELKPKLRNAGTGLALFGVAGVSVVYGSAALLATVTLLLALLLPAWAAALIVTAALFAAAGVTALIGRARLRRAGPLIPDEAIESIKSDLRAIGRAAQRRSDVAAGTHRGPAEAAGPLPPKTATLTADPLPPKTATLTAGPLPPRATSLPRAERAAVVRIGDPVRRHPGWWAAVGAGMVATGAAVAVLRRRRAHRTPPASAVRAWRAVVGRLGR